MQAIKRSGLKIAVALSLGCGLVSAEPYTWGNVAFEGGGFVSAVVPSRTQPGLVYTRTDVGGAYRWDSVGGKWIPLMDWLTEKDRGLYGTEALALDPNDSKRLYILAGTTYFSGGKTMILRSSDYGATFDTVNVTSKILAHGNGMGRQTGEKLAVDPLNSAILFCGSRTKGLYRSQDTGKTWTAVAGTAVTAGSSMVNDNGISYLLFDRASGKAANGGTKTVYMGVSSNTTSLYVSQDGGVSFTAVADAPKQMAMRAVLVGTDLYGTFSAGPGPHSQNGGSVWKLATGSGTWTKITPKDADGFDLASGKEGYGYGFGAISVDPKNPKRLILSTLGYYGGSNSWPTPGKGNAGDKFFLTEDGGATWKDLNPWGADDGTAYNLDPNGNGWITGASIHWAGSIEFDPFDNRKVWVTSGNGMFRTDDVSASRVIWTFQSKGIEETVPMDMVSVPGGPLVTAIMDYDGATYADIYRSAPQHQRPIGSSNSLGYAALTGGFLRSGRITDYAVKPAVTFDALYHSKDSGRTWTMTDTAKLPGSAGSLAMSTDGRVFLLRPSYTKSGLNASTSTFYRSTDGGKTWAPVTGISNQKGTLVSDPVDPALFYIIPDGYQGDVLGSTDSGKTFAKISSLSDNAKGQYSASSGLLRVAPGHKGHLWVPLDAEQSWTALGYSSNGLAHSTDAGKTWTRLNTMDACLAIGLGKAAPGAAYHALYMWGMANGGPLGIYRSIDKGATWTRVNDDAHQYGGPANGNFVMGDFNVFGRVYMSTAGRGLVVGEPTGGIVGVSREVPTARGLRRVGSQLASPTEIVLLDLRGRVVRTARPVDGGAVLELASVPRGLYLARSGGEALRVHSVR
jgi:xyloglucan-specific exo-beta-1,4-glucanase